MNQRPHSDPPSAPRHRAWAWVATCLVLIAVSLALWLLPAHADPATWRPWTPWITPLLHLNGPHLLANTLALGALAVLGAALPAPPRDALALCLAWPLGTWALRLWPEVGAFQGLSGTVHAAAAILAWRALRRPATRQLGWLLGLGLLLKLALERGWAEPVRFDPAWGFNVVVAAHLTGAVAGAALAALLDGLARWCGRTRGPVP